MFPENLDINIYYYLPGDSKASFLFSIIEKLTSVEISSLVQYFIDETLLSKLFVNILQPSASQIYCKQKIFLIK